MYYVFIAVGMFAFITFLIIYYLLAYIYQNQWSTVFSSIVSRAMTIEVLSTGVAGNYNGALQVV